MLDLAEPSSWITIVGIFRKVAREYDAKCFKRKRILDSLMLVVMILKMVQSRSSQSYATVISDFWNKATTLLPRLSFVPPVSQSSFSDARSKLNPTIFKEINFAFVGDSFKDEHRLLGHRIFAVDGSKINLPRNLIDEGFAIPNPQSYYPQGLISTLYDLIGKVPVDFMLCEKKDERACALKHLNFVEKGDVVVYDRGYHSYALLYEHLDRDIYIVLRMETTTTFNAVKMFAKSKSNDKIVYLTPAEGSLGKIKKSYPGLPIRTIRVRLVKYTIAGTQFVLATTLLDKDKYPRKFFVELYHSRWGIEEMYKSFKYSLTDNFHGKSRLKVEQEIFANFLLMTIARIFANSSEIHEVDLSKKKIAYR
jgi:hypothetical protein